MDLLKILNKNFKGEMVKHNNWIMFSCPFAKIYHVNNVDNNPSFGVNIQWPHGYNCFSCGQKGKSLKNLIKKIESVYGKRFDIDSNFNFDIFTCNFNLSHDIYKTKNVIDFTYLFETLEPCYSHPFLNKRGIDFSLAKKLKVCYDKTTERLCFPSIDVNNTCVSIQGRSLNSSLPKYKFLTVDGKCNNGVLYNEYRLDYDKPVILVEGVFDVAKVYQVWYNVTTFYGINPDKFVLEKLKFFPKLYVLFDNDKAGDNGTLNLINTFGNLKCKDIRIDNGYKDPGETPLQLLHNQLNKYTKPLGRKL